MYGTSPDNVCYKSEVWRNSLSVHVLYFDMYSVKTIKSTDIHPFVIAILGNSENVKL